MAICRNLWLMMLRVKARPLKSPLTRRSSNVHESTGMPNALNFASTCAAISFGVLVITPCVGVYLPVCLSIAMVISVLSGLCLSELLTSHTQGCQSVYSCLYQSVSEVLSFIVGWTWILSLSATLGAVLKYLSVLVDEASSQHISSFIESNVSLQGFDILAAVTAVIFSILCLTGISFSTLWPIVCMPLVLLSVISIVTVETVTSNKSKWMTISNIYDEIDGTQMMNGTALCLIIFLGPHSVLRLPTLQVHRSSSKLMGLWNIVCYVFSLIGGGLLIFTNYYSKDRDLFPFAYGQRLFTALSIPPMCLLAIEHYYPLLTVIQDMANDGLLCRRLGRKFKLCCQKVPTCWAFLLVCVLTVTLSASQSLMQVLKLSAIATLLINLVVSLTLLVQRYRYRDSWQYEPMLQNGTASRHCPRKKSTEFLPENELSSTAIGTKVTDSDTDESSETDIDSVVQEYMEKVKIANLGYFDSRNNNEFVEEPTASTFLRAKIFVVAHVLNSLILSVCLSFAVKSRILNNIALLIVMAVTLLLCFICLGLLSRIPFNNSLPGLRHNKTGTTVPMFPWIPGILVIISVCLLMYVITETWQVFLGWTTFGLLLYLAYGIRNSTAASSFYKMPIPSQLCNLQPFPLQKGVCTRQVIQPERKNRYKSIQMQ